MWNKVLMFQNKKIVEKRVYIGEIFRKEFFYIWTFFCKIKQQVMIVFIFSEGFSNGMNSIHQ